MLLCLHVLQQLNAFLIIHLPNPGMAVCVRRSKRGGALHIFEAVSVKLELLLRPSNVRNLDFHMFEWTSLFAYGSEPERVESALLRLQEVVECRFDSMRHCINWCFRVAAEVFCKALYNCRQSGSSSNYRLTNYGSCTSIPSFRGVARRLPFGEVYPSRVDLV